MSNSNHDTKVIVGLSGGVDSAVAALLLKEQGYDVSAIFMRNWEADDDDPYCTFAEDLEDAKNVAEKLEISLTVVNFSKDYWQRVFNHFLNEYSAGRTPNPDLLCNKEIKFKAFLDHALNEGADFIATGHYCRKSENEAGEYLLLKGKDQNKDQSYFLSLLNQHQLKHALFPIGELEKSEVREMAKKAGFKNHNKKDSTGICFIGERKFKDFLNEYLLKKPGVIVDTSGNIIAQHDGLMFYTLGQRQGLGIGGRKDAEEKPWYVVKKDLEQNRLVVAQEENHPLLLQESLVCNQVNWTLEKEPKLPFSGRAKVRYRQKDQACSIEKIDDETLKVTFEEKQRAITPGQAVVFYDGEICLGGGTILRL